ncbi:MAG: glycosyltransferase [Planctomycetota bacterium]|mgnify:CR=1 FL=1|nr:MAG: glycosyltransferase [Planctomycetota bacterium]REK25813.1 MAG: glycosyltransferase [Planctomycetota bacterium]REK49484.1 MAG: glycosyltransferase [Planctomycetota bacterium]
MELRASLLISHSNEYRELELSLALLAVQGFRDFEVIVCDDGSHDHYRLDEIMALYREFLNVDGVTRADAGFRLAAIWNAGAAKAIGERLISTNADLIASRGFLWFHAQPPVSVICCGTCHRIPRGYRDRVLAMSDPEGVLFFAESHYVPDMCSDTVKSPGNVYGGNWSINARRFRAVGGLDESFVGWAGEDADIGLRFSENGGQVYLSDVPRAYHIDHVARHETQPHGTEHFRRKWKARNSTTALAPERAAEMKPNDGMIRMREH